MGKETSKKHSFKNLKSFLTICPNQPRKKIMKLLHNKNERKRIIPSRLSNISLEKNINKELHELNINYSLYDLHGLFSILNYDMCELENSITTNSLYDILENEPRFII